MSGFDTSNIFNKQGKLGVTDPNPNEVTRRGTQQGALVSGESIDRWGNINAAVFAFVGRFNFSVATPVVKLEWTTDNQDISTNLSLSSGVSTTYGILGAIAGHVIEYSGVLSGDGTRALVIAGSTSSLGGGAYGGGEVILSGVSTFAGSTSLESPAKLTVKGTGAIPSLTVNTGATLSTLNNTTATGIRALTFQNGSYYNVQAINATTMSKLKLTNATLGKYNTASTTTGPVISIDAGADVDDGVYPILEYAAGNGTVAYPQTTAATAPLFTNVGTLGSSTLSGGTTGLELIGHRNATYLCKNIAGYFQDSNAGIIFAKDGETLSTNMVMNTTAGTGGNFSIAIVVKAGKTWTYSGIASPMTAGGVTTAHAMVQGGGTWKITNVNTMNAWLDVVAGSGIGVGTSTTAKWQYPVTMIGATSRLVVTPTAGGLSCGKLSVGNVFNAASGFTVDIEGPMLNSVFDIITQTGTTTPIPTVGVNLSGRTPSFAWVAKTLKMTLA